MAKEGLSESLLGIDVFDEHVFLLLLHWMYTKEMEVPGDEGCPLELLTKLWLMGDQFMMPRLQNAAMDKIAPLLQTADSTSFKKFLDVS